ncbi:hypothetical protein TcWFU_009311 [Taenia crassiceps]|uniref:Uncharacterized protein n=1 Tax=Taenia crassiceps TaxID=6207 RepID=A0ABR4Q0D9_9CEST
MIVRDIQRELALTLGAASDVAMPGATSLPLQRFVGFGLESKLRSQDRLSSASATPTKTFDEARLERRLNNTEDDLPGNWVDVVTSPKLHYRRDLMFDKNK